MSQRETTRAKPTASSGPGRRGHWLPLLMVAAGCADGGTPPRHPPGKPRVAESAASDSTSDGSAPVSHRESGHLELLDVPDHSPAVVWVPPPGQRPQPLLVAAHGAGGRPEWHCDFWSRIVEDRGFVLCPRGRRIHRGVPHDQSSYYFPDHFWLGRVVHAAMTTLGFRFANQVDPSDAVYAGYSQGAIMGALIVAPEPTRFPLAVFVEGGGAEWNVPIAAKYLEGGGRRVAFVCGVSACDAGARRAVQYLDRAGLAARRAYAPGAGHTYRGPVEPLVAAAFEWLVAADPRWRQPPEPPVRPSRRQRFK